MDEEKQVTQYIVPANVTTQFEFFPGFGWKQFFPVAIAVVLGIILFMILSKLETIIRLIILVVPVVSTFALVKKGDNGMSLADMIRHMRDFKKKQNRYLYIYNSAKED